MGAPNLAGFEGADLVSTFAFSVRGVVAGETSDWVRCTGEGFAAACAGWDAAGAVPATWGVTVTPFEWSALLLGADFLKTNSLALLSIRLAGWTCVLRDACAFGASANAGSMIGEVVVGTSDAITRDGTSMTGLDIATLETSATRCT